MRKPPLFHVTSGSLLLVFACSFLCSNLNAQTKITDYVIFGGKKDPTFPQTAPLAPGYGVQLGASSNIQGGSIGSYHLVKSTGSLTIGTNSTPTNIYSGGTIQLANGNVVTGKITAANQYTLPSLLPGGSTILSVGTSATLGNNIGGGFTQGNIDVNGSIVIGGGSVLGKVTIPPNKTTPPTITYTYSGPVPAGGTVVRAAPTLPTLPVMPDTISFPAAGSVDKTSGIITRGAYGNLTIGGNTTVTLSDTGTYIFKSITSTGPNSQIIFDFKNRPSGNFRIYVYGNVALNKLTASIINGGSPSRIYSVTHGKGSVAWDMSNGSNGTSNTAIWLGTIWAPFGAIVLGTPNGPASFVTGALLSGTQVNIQGAATINYAPFNFCDNPITANAGVDKPLDFSPQTMLTGSPATGVSYNWQAINGGVITTSPPNTATIAVSASGGYILTVTATASSNCVARDTVVVSSRLKSIIGSELQSIYDNKTTDTTFFDIKNGYVLIDVIANAGYKKAAYDSLIKPAYGLRPDTLSNGASNFIITGEIPRDSIPNLNRLNIPINYCRPHYRGFTNNGLVTSAGDTSVRSWLVRNGYSLNGDDIKIGVISNSFNTITAKLPPPPITNTAPEDVGNDDLPGPGNINGFIKPVHVLRENPNQRSDEGRAMAQIIHDVAPGAELYFHTGSITAGNFAEGIRKLDSAGCKVIVDDITYTTEPYLKDGVVARAVDTAKKHGVTYFSAAGNFAGKSYENPFVSLAAAGFPAGTKAHNFGGGDIYNSISLKPGDYVIVAQWTDSIYSIGQSGTKNDLDIYLTSNTDGTGLFGFNRDNTNNGGGDPTEFILTRVTRDTTTNIVIVNNTIGSNPSRIKIIVFRIGGLNPGLRDITFNDYKGDSSTVIGQTNALGAIAIGAARYHKTNTVEYFSSIGGTTVNGIKRPNPWLVGPDGVNTTVNMGADLTDPVSGKDGYSNFSGTSAAAPHAAGVAALIMQGRKKFLNELLTVNTPDTIRKLLTTTAIDMGPAGFDFASGYGFINADLAMRTFAAPRPFLDSLIVPANVIPGDTSFKVTIIGNNLSSSSKVYFNDSLLQSTIIKGTDTATALIPVFDGNPSIRVYTAPISISGLDGGFSNSLFFPERKKIIVKAANKTKKYGQQTPAFTDTVWVDGVLLENTNPRLTLADLGLTSMTLVVPAIATNPGNVGTYSITPTRVFDPENPVDSVLLQKYNYKFITGTFTIEKLPLTITVNNVTVNYGDKIPDATFTYQFDVTNISNPSVFLNTIKSAHQNQLQKDAQGHDVLGLVNGQGVIIDNGQAIVIDNGQGVVIDNGQPSIVVGNDTLPIVNPQALTIVNNVVTDTTGYDLTNSDIQNLSFLATTQSLQNARQIANVTGTTTVVDITQESILNFNVNAGQTYMLNSLTGVDPKGLIDVQSYTNGQGIVIDNGQGVIIDNGQGVIIDNGNAVTIDNGQGIVIDNATGDTIVVGISHNRTAVVVDVNEIGDGQSQLKSLNIITGLDAGKQFIIPGAFNNSNFDITNIPGVVTINKRTITVKADNISRQYGVPNPPLTVTYSGFIPGENLQKSDITGIPTLSTTALQTSPAGIYPITVANGTLASSNYKFSFVNGILTITDTCLLTRSPFNNFGSTTQNATSLWVNIEVKVSGQLKKHNDSLVFKTGTITFNDIIDPVTNTPIPMAVLRRGVIIADATVATPVTTYNIGRQTWITRIPAPVGGFASTSDIFITGTIINSPNGFVKKKTNSNSNTVVKGYFYSNTTFSDQWTYGLATYQPIFDYPAIAGTAGTGKVVAINGAIGSYRAGTPLSSNNNPINTLVNGGSGGGGNNYTGSTSSYDNFTACPLSGNSTAVTRISGSVQEEVQNISASAGEVQIIPNPASNYIMLSFVPTHTGNSEISLFTMDGKKIFETKNGIGEAGIKYQKKIDVSRLINGVYVIQLKSADKITIKKIIINR